MATVMEIFEVKMVSSLSILSDKVIYILYFLIVIKKTVIIFFS